ncbi:MAG TPA: hypothetical protein VE990_13825 [Acidimicrobiales bacterium]|nr:hypothetical protein [Acidimicrobiales bacterium]
MEDAARVAGDAASKDPATGLRAVWALGLLRDELERLQVDSARDQGWTWQQIADALSVSRQAVHQKHARRRALEAKE